MDIKDRKCEVLIVSTSIQHGGTELNSVKFYNFYLKLGINVNFLLSGKNYLKATKIENLIELNNNRLLFALPSLIHQVIKLNPKVILCFFDHVSVAILIAKRVGLIRAKVIIRPSTVVSAYNGSYMSNKTLFRLIKIVYKWADLIYCQSNTIMEDLIRNIGLNSNKLKLVRNSVCFQNRKSSELIMGNSEGYVKIVSVGNLRKEKGYDRVIEYLSKVSTPFKYIIIGDGPERVSIEKILIDFNLNDSVKLEGHLQNPNFILSECDVLLLGSYVEGYPNVVLEALSLNKPVIGFNDCTVLKELVFENETGFLVQNYEELNISLSKILNGFSMNKSVVDTILNNHSEENILKLISQDV